MGFFGTCIQFANHVKDPEGMFNRPNDAIDI